MCNTTLVQQQTQVVECFWFFAADVLNLVVDAVHVGNVVRTQKLVASLFDNLFKR
jgi:hypothetical protein